jgi:predicted ATPase
MSEDDYDDDWDDDEDGGSFDDENIHQNQITHQQEEDDDDEINNKEDSFSLLEEIAEDASAEFEVASVSKRTNAHSSMAITSPSKKSPKGRSKGALFSASFVGNGSDSDFPSHFDSSYVFSTQEMKAVTDEFNKSGSTRMSSANAAPTNNTTQTIGSRQVLLPNNHMPFVGRQHELETLTKCVERITLEWMENPSEVVWLSGKKGVGKTTLVQHASDTSSSISGVATSQNNGFAKSFVCRGTCEQYHTAAQPFQALSDCLNDLCLQLLKTQTSRQIWKARLEDALGGEGPLVGTICPILCHQLLECAPMDRRALQVFDANTPQRINRLAFAVRDLLLAVSEHHPIVMMVDQIQFADPDSLTLLKDLLSTKPLQNFLLIGIYDSSLVNDKNDTTTGTNSHPLVAVKELLAADPLTRTTELRLQGFSSDDVTQVLYQTLLTSQGSSEEEEDDLAELSALVFVLTKGNPLWIVQLLRLWNDQKLITTTKDTVDGKWTWSRKKIKKEVKRWREEGLECSKSLQGVIQARLELLPKKIQFVVMILGKLKLTSIRLHDDVGTGTTTNSSSSSSSSSSISSHFYRVFVAAAYRKIKKGETDPIASQAELEKMVLKACAWGVLKKLHRAGFYKFANDLIRECAATLTSPYDDATKDKKGSGNGNPLKIQLYMGTELSALSMEATKRISAAASTTAAAASAAAAAMNPPTSPTPGGGGPAAAAAANSPNRPPSAALVAAAQQRERYKFLAVEQLHTVHAAMDDAEKGKLAKINLEAAEIAISKTAFQTAIVYLERGIAAVDHTMRWEQRYYDVTLRTFLFLARMRLCCGRTSAAKAACEEIFENCATIKDRVYATQVLMVLFQRDGKYDKAMVQLLEVLKRLGEVFPTGDDVKNIVEREMTSLRKGMEKLPNQQLLNPKKMTDKKAADTMMLLATMADFSKHVSPTYGYQELATIRMMHVSLKMGFTRQYPLAFSLFGVALVQRGYIKEAHRMGQVAEKIARLNDFYGGEAIALFHWHISHWRRSYKRNLQPVLKIYNAQVDSGDFYHVGFSITTYIQYHFASGFDIEKLSDNLQLFQGLYMDYQLKDNWLIDISQEAVSNLMGETATPLIFFGQTLGQQDTKIEEFRKARLPQAIEYLYLLRLFIAFFFHNVEVMEECFEQLESPAVGVWIPWIAFMECFMLIQYLPAAKGKQRKELKEKIDLLRNKLLDWYNAGAPNPNAMISILEAEWVIAKEAGKGLSAMKAQELFNEAVEAAAKADNTHLEAFACERAGMHFLRTGVEGHCADYMKKSYKIYDQCHYISKVIDLETNHADLLNITQKRARPASAYSHMNAGLKPSDKKIGGGQQEIKTVNMKKGFKKAAKAIRKTGVKQTGRKVKGLFKKEKAAPAPWGWGSKDQLALDENGGANEDDPMSPSPKPTSSRKIFGGRGKKNKNEDDEEDANDDTEQQSSPTSAGTSPRASQTKPPMKSPLRPISRLFRKSKPPLSDDKEGDSEEEDGGEPEDINDVLESPKPRGSRVLQTDADNGPMDLPFDDDDDDDSSAEDEEEPKAKKDKKKKKKSKN